MSTTSGKPGLRSITGRQWLILLAVQLSSLLFAMTITLANVVLPQIRGALSTTNDEIAWVVTLNLAATAVATPTTGWLASRLGWRGLMFGGVGGFTLFSLLCGLANSLETLVLYRVGQGMCGAVIMPMGQAIVLATFPRELHAAVMVIWGFGSVVGPVVCPVLGSMIAETYSW
jgi:MFS transporter, DHA2 family, multidrug resistance protein